MLTLDLDVSEHRLGNGLRVLLHRDLALPLVAIDLWYHVGSRNERLGRTGLAHLFEHMLFQGSANVGTNDHFKHVQAVGGVANGSTWYDRTNYYETVPAHALELGLWLEADRMGWLLPALTEEKLETQRDVVLNERLQQVDNQPYGRALERLHELLYPHGHPYSWPVIGYTEDIEAADLDDVRRFFERHYRPNNAVLTLAGDVDIAALDLVERYFGEIPAGPEVGRQERPHDTTRRAASETLVDDVPLRRAYLGARLDGYGSPQWYAADLLSTCLTGGKSSLLYRDLVYDRQLAQNVAAMLFPTELESTFLIIATAKPETDIEELVARIEEHLDRLGSAELAADLVESARQQSLVAFFDGLQGLARRADLLCRYATFVDDPGWLVSELDAYRNLTPADLRRVAAERLEPARLTRVTVVPPSGSP